MISYGSPKNVVTKSISDVLSSAEQISELVKNGVPLITNVLKRLSNFLKGTS